MVGSVRMKDRKKFHIFDMTARNRALLDANSKEAMKKQEEAATPKDGETDMTKPEVRMGRAIRVGDFKRLLTSLNPSLIFQLSNGDPSKYGIYVPVGKSRRVADKTLVQDIVFVVGMESGLNLGGRIDEGVMPEFSIIVTEDIVVPDGDAIKKVPKFKREIRGWRTVLAVLHQDGHLTEPQIEATFHISEGKSSANWQRKVNQVSQV